MAIRVWVFHEEQYIPGYAGQLLSGNEVKIVDINTGESLGTGIDGEIRVRGLQLFSGYLNNDGANEEAFDNEGWLKTGDIGHYDYKERLFITDRIKELIRVYVDNTFQHLSPVSLEHFLMTHESLAGVAVVGVNTKIYSQWPRAYVQLKAGHTVSGEDIQQFVSANLSSVHDLKAGVQFVEHIHRTFTGKVDQKYYRDLVKDEIID